MYLHPVELKLRHAFTTTHETRQSVWSLIVQLTQDGHAGLGEAVAIRYYGLKIEDMQARLRAIQPWLEAYPLNSPEQFWEDLQMLADAPFLRCALDVAAHDLYGKLHGHKVYERQGLSPKGMPLSNFTIGIAGPEEMLAKMQEQPWPVYKIKLDAEHGLDTVRFLRKHTDATFRIDANTGWTAAQALEYAPQLKELGVEMIEQPLPVDDWEGMAALFPACPLPLIADESCQTEEDVERCHGYFHGINIKLMKCGGLTPAYRMAKRARELGMQVMAGCMTESSVGISAIAQLLSLLDYVDMDGAMLLANDPAEGVWLQDGRAQFPGRPGTGAQLKSERI